MIDLSAKDHLMAEPKFCHFFNDGVRTIDYVLTWDEDIIAISSAQPSADDTSRAARFRHKFQTNLSKAGIEMEKEITVTGKKRIHFLKLFVTWEAMCYYAEYLRLRAPLKLLSRPQPTGCKARLRRNNPLRDERVPDKPPLMYTCAFSASKLHKYIGWNSGDAAHQFTATQRHMVAYEILGTCAYGQEAAGEIGIDRMVEEDIYSSAFPLHEGPHWLPIDADNANQEQQSQQRSGLNCRQILRIHWASWCNWCKYQPLDHVRQYFGEKIAFYFAWLGLYTTWLLPATLVGIVVFLYGLATLSYDVPTKEACNSNKAFKMCPMCNEKDGCKFWHLSDICWKIQLANLFDHPGTVLYSVFVSFWAVTFLEFWVRRNAALTHRWGVASFSTEIERPRPRYSIGCNEHRENPITKDMEPFFPRIRRLPRLIVSTLCLILMLAIVLAFIVVIILYQTVISIYLMRTTLSRSTAKLIANASGALLHLVIMLILESFYEWMARKLTEWEMHRTQCKFEDQLTTKVFIFEVFNYYSSIFYIAFLKGRFAGYPGNYGTLFGFRLEECDEGGCLLDLALSLGIILFGRQVLITTAQIILPRLLKALRRSRYGLAEDAASSQWEADYGLPACDSQYNEYLQMVLQFGFITIFVAAFPLAPLFALLNNWAKIRLDAKRLVLHSRRPLAERANSIGVWSSLLEMIAAMSVISNAFLVAFTSDFLPKMLYMFEYGQGLHGYVNFSLALAPANTTSELCRYRHFRDPTGSYTPFYWKLLVVQLSFVIVFEHLVFSVRRLIQLLIADQPKELRLRIERESYLGRQALVEAVLMEHPAGNQQFQQAAKLRQLRAPRPAYFSVQGRSPSSSAAAAGQRDTEATVGSQATAEV